MFANILNESWVHSLGWVLVHLFWQGLAVAGILWLLLYLLRTRSAQARYLTACAALGLLILTPFVTWWWISTPIPKSEPVNDSAGPEIEFESVRSTMDPMSTPAEFTVEPAEKQSTDTYVAESSAGNWKQHALTSLETVLPWIVIGWIIGVLVLSLWRFTGWLRLQTIKKRLTKPINRFWQQKVKILAERLRITRPIRLLESCWVPVPSVIGWLRPVILVPSAALTGTTPQQLEALLLHELAHIRRYDYLVNLLQTIVEILGFYHPAVWWISRRMRIERENCCDDLAADMLGDKLTYARALTQMEHLRRRPVNLAVAADGGSLWQRITRLVGVKTDESSHSGWLSGIVLILLIAVGVVSTVLAQDQKPTVAELIRKHETNRTKIKSFIIVSETTYPGKTITLHNGKKIPNKNIPPIIKEIRTDGKRFYIEETDPTAFQIPQSVFVPNDSHSRIWIWDGRYYYFYGHRSNEYFEAYARKHRLSTDERNRLIRNSRSVIVYANPDHSKVRKMIDRRRPYGLFNPSLQAILRNVDQVFVRDETRIINGSNCYVIEAVKAKNKEILWIDPDHGCNIAKRITWKKGKKTFESWNIRFQQIEDVWVPVEYDFQYFNTQGYVSEDKHHVRISKIRFHPDHQKLKSFLPQPQNGSKVKITQNTGTQDKYQFTWQYGKVLNEQGKVILDTSIQSDDSVSDRSPSTAESNQTKIP